MRCLQMLHTVHTNTSTLPRYAMSVERGTVIQPASITLRVGLGTAPGVVPHALEALAVCARTGATANRILSPAQLRYLACTRALLLALMEEGTQLSSQCCRGLTRSRLDLTHNTTLPPFSPERGRSPEDVAAIRLGMVRVDAGPTSATVPTVVSLICNALNIVTMRIVNGRTLSDRSGHHALPALVPSSPYV